jgi:hypothetical protein
MPPFQTTDIMGYRAEGGALGQDQAVSKQLGSILSSKLPLLSAPGSVIENALYYDVTSSSVSAVEMQATFAKDRIVLSNMNIGSNPTCYIPSQLFAGSAFWVCQLPNIEYPSSMTNPTAADDGGKYRFYAPLGWGFAALQSVLVYMGASNVAQIELDWYANLMIALAACETVSKRQEMLTGAGRLMDNYSMDTIMYPAVASSANQTIFQNNFSITNATFQKEILGADLGMSASYIPMTTAVVPLRLPFCSMAVLEKKLSIDTKLLTQPIQIALQTKQPDQFLIMGGSMPKLQQWSNSSIQLWQEELSDKSLSVRNELLANPEYNVSYPSQYVQSIPFSFPASDSGLGNVTYGGNSYNSQQITMNITSIINADLTTMLFMVCNGLRSTTSDYNVTNIGNMNQFCPLFGEELSNIQLLLNGQRFFAFDQGIYPFVTLAKQMSAVKSTLPIPYQGINAKGYTAMLPHKGKNASSNNHFAYQDSYVYELNFSRLRAIIAESHLQNTARFTNQTFQLTFNVERSKNYICNNGTSAQKDAYLANLKSKMELRMVYLYNSVLYLGGDGGTTKLITN